MIGSIVYIAVFLLVFFVSSFVVSKYSNCYEPTRPDTFLLLVGVTLIWPVTVPLGMMILLLHGIARLAEIMAGN